MNFKDLKEVTFFVRSTANKAVSAKEPQLRNEAY